LRTAIDSLEIIFEQYVEMSTLMNTGLEMIASL